MGAVAQPGEDAQVLDLLLSHETEIGRRKAAKVRENRWHERAAHAEPLGQGGGILVNAGAGDPSPGSRVAGTVNGEVRKGAVDLLTLNGAAEDQVIVAPAMVGAVPTVDQESPAEIAAGELSHAAGDSELNGRAVERIHA